MRQSFALLVLLLLTASVAAQENPEARKLYDDGNRKLNMGRIAEAVAKFDAALAIEKHENYYYQKGLALRRAKDEIRAISCFHDALGLNEEFAPAHHALGNAHSALRQYRDAVRHYERALDLHPKLEIARRGLTSALTGLALSFADSMKFDAALETARKATAIDSAAFEAHLAAARALGGLARHLEAISEAETAMRISPSARAGASFEIGLAHKALGDLQNARRAFESALESDVLREHALRQRQEIDSLLAR